MQQILPLSFRNPWVQATLGLRLGLCPKAGCEAPAFVQTEQGAGVSAHLPAAYQSFELNNHHSP